MLLEMAPPVFSQLALGSADGQRLNGRPVPVDSHGMSDTMSATPWQSVADHVSGALLFTVTVL